MVGRTSSLKNQFDQFCLLSFKSTSYHVYRGIIKEGRKTNTQTHTHTHTHTHTNTLKITFFHSKKPLPMIYMLITENNSSKITTMSFWAYSQKNLLIRNWFSSQYCKIFNNNTYLFCKTLANSCF